MTLSTFGPSLALADALHAGVTLTVGDLVRLMLVWSDDTATSPLAGLVGTRNVDALLDARGVVAICARRVEDRSLGVDNGAFRTGARLSRLVHDRFTSVARRPVR